VGCPGGTRPSNYAVFDPGSHELQIASAGMPPGLFATASDETLTLRLQPGDSVLFSTEGVTDAFDHKENQFGIERLQELSAAQRRASPREFLRKVFAAVETFACVREQHDDMAAALFHLCS